MRARLRDRWFDIVLIAFFVVNLGFITYFFDIEQLTVPNAVHMTHYPAWPPAPVVDLVHWYGRQWDPLLMARPDFFKATIWIDVLFFGPFYCFALYAFVRGRDWIRVPALVWSGLMMANVGIILYAERFGPHASPHFGMVLGANLCWFLFPIAVIVRLSIDRPFSRFAKSESTIPVAQLPTPEPARRPEPA